MGNNWLGNSLIEGRPQTKHGAVLCRMEKASNIMQWINNPENVWRNLTTLFSIDSAAAGTLSPV